MFNSPTFKCGRHSGFPICCILWYIYIWIPLFVRHDDPKYNSSFTQWYHKIKNKIVRRRNITHTVAFPGDNLINYDGILVENWPGYGRIPCPFCLLFSKKHHNVLPCDCKDARNKI
jgi:hypothetical protein